MNTPWPVRLSFQRARRQLAIEFDDGIQGEISFARLRLESPSAETRGHGGTRPPPPPIPADLTIHRAEPVGRYAVRLFFSDGHSSGLFTWTQLHTLIAAPDDQNL